ncbi:unnamed protein product [Vitrella brassicaformis CCMP3155]|uniref:Uncharacterized protein n=1 Tax=Vitrella brassicaformis (strain CCMP3155) TaxID=1169540 RepID=A0A0G4EE10_VITBC|nr:unnamed protein product [Vitrella brassicaformis CCMP3155]|eukprot:CEL94217.1 unnamed protein product [Vitrella brassicaformis CCMP3155]
MHEFCGDGMDKIIAVLLDSDRCLEGCTMCGNGYKRTNRLVVDEERSLFLRVAPLRATAVPAAAAAAAQPAAAAEGEGDKNEMDSEDDDEQKDGDPHEHEDHEDPDGQQQINQFMEGFALGEGDMGEEAIAHAAAIGGRIE